MDAVSGMGEWEAGLRLGFSLDCRCVGEVHERGQGLVAVSGMRLPGSGRGRDGSELEGRRRLSWAVDGRAVGVWQRAGLPCTALSGRRRLSRAVDGRAVGVWQRAGVPCAAGGTWWSAARRRRLLSRLSPCSTSSTSRREE
jgi:hypothetical protein